MAKNHKPTKRKAFNFLRSYFDILNELESDSDKLEFLLSIINKQFLDEDPKDLSFIVNLCYESQRHGIEQSVKGYKDKTKQDLIGNPLVDPTQDPTKGGCQAPCQQEKEKEKEQEKEKDRKYVFNFKNSLIEYGFKKELVEDWLKVRKTKKASNTKTAFNNFIKEIERRNCNLNEVLELIVAKSWSGFKWTWYDNENVNINKANDNEPKNYGKGLNQLRN